MSAVFGTVNDDLILPSGSSGGVDGSVTSGPDTINGQGGRDTIDGGGGDDQITDGDTALELGDSLMGGDGDDVISSSFGADTISGGAGNDTISLSFLGSRNNIIIRIEGADVLDLRRGDVLLVVADTDLTGVSITSANPSTAMSITVSQPVLLPDSFNYWGIDILAATAPRFLGGDADESLDFSTTELVPSTSAPGFYEAGGGNDTVVTTRGTPLVLDGGAGDDSLRGLDAADSLIGGTGGDTLDGGGGADTIAGGLGNDLYLVGDPGDRVIERGPGADTVRAAADHALANGVEVLLLEGAARRGTGNNAGNLLIGTEGDDLLNGRAGADTMAGGAGNDLYYVDQPGDLLEDSGGLDTVASSVDWVLAAGFESLLLLGGAGLDGTGNGLGNAITGNAGANSLSGLDGDDTLDGRAGADTMDGGLGHDRFVVDHAGDLLLDAGGVELVLASVSWTLAAGFERLALLGGAGLHGTGNAARNVITGNAGANSLAGLGGDDLLDGRAGADTLDGGAGNDTFTVDSAGDVLIDSGGVDLVRAALDWTLAAGFETLELLPGAVSGTGNAAANRITGHAAPNQLSGGDGADTLIGRGGADLLLGGAGNDLFLQRDRGEGTDDLFDFTKGQDLLGLGAAGFGLPAGALAESNFLLVVGSPTATSPSGTPQVMVVLTRGAFGIITEEAVWFDPDGAGGVGAERLFNNSGGVLSGLAREDFLIVA